MRDGEHTRPGSPPAAVTRPEPDAVDDPPPPPWPFGRPPQDLLDDLDAAGLSRS